MQWIHRFAVLADFKVQDRIACISFANFSDYLALADPLAFGDKYIPIMRIGAEIIVVMLNDDQVTKADQTISTVDHFTRSGCVDIITGVPRYIDAFGFTVLVVKF